MHELVKRLLTADAKELWQSLLSHSNGLLDVAVRRFLTAPLDTVDDLRSAAERAWELLGQCASRADLKWCCGNSVNRPFRGVDPDLVFAGAGGYFAAAMVLGGLRRDVLASPLAVDALIPWLERLGASRQSLAQLPERLAAVDASDFTPQFLSACELLPPPAAMQLRLHARHFLGDGAPALEPVHRVWVHFPTFDDLTKSGAVYLLELQFLQNGPPGLFRDPASFALPVARDFQSVLDRAFGLHTFSASVVWSLQRRTPSGLVATVSGESHTAAVCVAFRALAEGRVIDPGCVLTAKFDKDVEKQDWEPWGRPGTKLRPINGIEAKCKAVSDLAEGHFDRVLFQSRDLPADQDRYPPGGAGGAGRTLRLSRPNTLEDAYQDATGLIGELRRYYQAACDLIDSAKDTAPYLEGRNLSELYIEPDVLRDVIRPPVDGPEADRDSSPHRTNMEAASESEEKSQHSEEARRERVAWRLVWQQGTRFVVVGKVGDGKTTLAKRLLRDLAEHGLKELDAGDTPVTRLTTPVFLKLSDVSASPNLDAAIRSGVNELLPGEESFTDALVQHIQRAARTGKGTFILDGFDEVPSEHHQNRFRHLESLVPLPCRVVVTSRPYGFQNGGVPFDKVIRVGLAPLSMEQQQQFVTAWFGASTREASDKSGWQERVRALVVGGSLGEMCRNTLLLTFTCAEAELLRDGLPANTRRPELYQWVVRDLIRGAWRTDPPPLAEHDGAINDQMRLLRRACWALIAPAPARSAFTEDEWKDAIEGLDVSVEKTSLLMAQWTDRGLLLPQMVVEKDSKRHGRAFAHRSILEYFAAARVAELPDPVAAVSGYLWTEQSDASVTWEPDAQELIQFVAGCMDDPTPLLDRLMWFEREKQDALYVMARLAGKCLIDVDHTRLSRSPLVTQVLDAAYGAYLTLGGTETFAQPLRSAAAGAWLEVRWGEASSEQRRNLLLLVGHIGAIGATPRLVDQLLETVRLSPSPRHLAGDALPSDAHLAARTLGVIAADPTVRPTVREAFLASLSDPTTGVGSDRVLVWERLDSRAATPAVLNALLAALSRARGEEHYYDITRVIRSLGAGAATRAVFDALADGLRQPNLRHDASKALIVLSAYAPPLLLDVVVNVLREEDASARWHAALVLKVMRTSVAPTPDVLGTLVNALKDQDGDVRETARLMLRRMNLTTTPGVADHMATALTESAGRARLEWAEALGAVGSAAASARPRAALLDALQDTRVDVRLAATQSLGWLGPSAATPEVLARVQVLRRDADARLRVTAVRALWALGAVAYPEVQAELLSALQDNNDDVCSAAAQALKAIGPGAAEPATLGALVGALQRRQQWLPFHAAQALGAMGAPAATAEVLGALLGGPGNYIPDVPREAFVAVCSATVAPSGTVLRVLETALREGDSRPRLTASDEMGKQLEEFTLRAADSRTRSAAARAVRKIGAVAITPGTLAGLVDALQTGDRELRFAAARALW